MATYSEIYFTGGGGGYELSIKDHVSTTVILFFIINKISKISISFFSGRLLIIVALTNPTHCSSPHHCPLLKMTYSILMAGGPHRMELPGVLTLPLALSKALSLPRPQFLHQRFLLALTSWIHRNELWNWVPEINHIVVIFLFFLEPVTTCFLLWVI